MSVQYHINQKTGNPNICKAKPGNCPLKNDDNQQAEHYNTKEEAHNAYESQMEAKLKAEEERKKDEREKLRQERTAEAERNWPTPTSDKVSEYKAKGYDVQPQYRYLRIPETPMSSSNIATIDVLAGSINASYSGEDSISDRTMSYRSQEHKEAKIEFTDYATRLTEDDARKHLKRLETALSDSNKFVDKINETVSDAEALYGRPKKSNADYNHYQKVESVDSKLSNNVQVLPAEEDKFPRSGWKSFTYRGNSFNLYVSKNPDGEVSTEVNMGSMQRSTDVNDFKERIYELRNVLATADALKKRL